MNTVRILIRTRKYKNQLDQKNITELKNTLEGTNSRISDTEECISDLKNRIMEIT